jgi:2-polyprenyl-6-methoxyphenol hydroxylase-like FAD-dependent oxidoreductase
MMSHNGQPRWAASNCEDQMSVMDRPLIVGAGPVGLGAALFLARHGRTPRLVEMRGEPSRESKALAVNPRTLEILKPSGVTRRMLELGLPIRGVQFHGPKRMIGSFSLGHIHPDYPFLLALSQAATERLLTEALSETGGHIERGVKMVGCRNLNGRAEADLESAVGGSRETIACPWLLAADGARSVARQSLGIAFAGSSFAEKWYLTDAPLRMRLPADHAHICFLEKGAFLFLMRVVNDVRDEQTETPLWRVLGNRPDPLSQLIGGEQAGPAVWASSFTVSHRINASLSAGHVYFAGDAAHIHSPAGARGMNLGLEDAWVFAELAQAGRLSEYDGLRRPIDRQVVHRVDLISRLASAHSRAFLFARTFLFPMAIKIPFARRRMLATITGLDHPLPHVAAGREIEGPLRVSLGSD